MAVRGDSVPIKKYKTKQHPKGEYMPYPYGPVQFPQAKKGGKKKTVNINIWDKA